MWENGQSVSLDIPFSKRYCLSQCFHFLTGEPRSDLSNILAKLSLSLMYLKYVPGLKLLSVCMCVYVYKRKTMHKNGKRENLMHAEIQFYYNGNCNH